MSNDDKQYEITFWEADPDDSGKKRIVRIPVTKEVFDEYYRPINAYRRKEQRHGRCICPVRLRLLCNMDCASCPYSVFGDISSLNDYIEDSDGDITEKCGNISGNSSLEEDYEYKELMHRIHEEISTLSPELRDICRLIMEGKNERDMAEALNMSKTTLHRHKETLLDLLRRELEKYL